MMELYSPYDTRILFEKTSDGLVVSFETCDTEHLEKLCRDGILTDTQRSHRFLIKDEKVYEITDGNLREISSDLESILDSDRGSCPSYALFGAVVGDLLSGKELDWIPQGFYYYSGLHFFVFSDRESLQKGIEVERERLSSYERKDKEIVWFSDEWYDQMESLTTYWFDFPTTGSAYGYYDIKKHFRRAFEK